MERSAKFALFRAIGFGIGASSRAIEIVGPLAYVITMGATGGVGLGLALRKGYGKS